MAKHSLRQSSRQIQTGETVGKELQQEIVVDDCYLPSPSELEEYKSVDPKIVQLLCDMSRKEQANRHSIEQMKMRIVKRSENREWRIDFCGMLFAFMTLIAMLGVSAFALYLNHKWFAGLLSSATIISVLSLFVSTKENKKKQ